MQNIFPFLHTERQRTQQFDKLLLASPRGICRKQNALRAVPADNFQTPLGIEVEHCRRIHEYGLAAELFEHLVRQLIAAHMRKNQLVVNDAAECVEHAQHHVRRTMNVVAIGNINACVCDDVQTSFCRCLHDAQIARVVKMNALIIGMELDAEQSAFLDKIERLLNVSAVRMNRTSVI